jgi:hypothetical protein
MATTMKDLMGLRRWALLAAGVTLVSALVLSLGASEAFAICMPGNEGRPIDSTPHVTQVSPQDGATGVSRSTNIKVTVSEAMDPATINGSTFQLHRYVYLCDRSTATCTWYFSQIPATVRKDSTDTTGRTYLLDPYDATSALLSANSRYRVTLTTGVRDLEDEYPIPSKMWYFTTGSS